MSAAGHSGWPRLALLGIGGVGRAFVQRLERLRPHDAVQWVANSRGSLIGELPVATLASLLPTFNAHSRPHGLRRLAKHLGPGGVVVDATASDAVAQWHARWLAQGLSVVTANKAGTGEALSRFRRIQRVSECSAGAYHDAATVGAGLPMLSTLRQLTRGGDALWSLQGILSGTLATLLSSYDGRTPFWHAVEAARQQGLTEPDPRVDLSGGDVLRKLLILLRSAGLMLPRGAVHCTPLMRPGESTQSLNTRLKKLHRQAQAAGAVLRYVARYDARTGARAGLEMVPCDASLARAGGDNVLSLETCRYRGRPLVIRGPGAGVEVTAATLLDGVQLCCPEARLGLHAAHTGFAAGAAGPLISA